MWRPAILLAIALLGANSQTSDLDLGSLTEARLSGASELEKRIAREVTVVIGHRESWVLASRSLKAYQDVFPPGTKIIAIGVGPENARAELSAVASSLNIAFWDTGNYFMSMNDQQLLVFPQISTKYIFWSCSDTFPMKAAGAQPRDWVRGIFARLEATEPENDYLVFLPFIAEVSPKPELMRTTQEGLFMTEPGTWSAHGMCTRYFPRELIAEYPIDLNTTDSHAFKPSLDVTESDAVCDAAAGRNTFEDHVFVVRTADMRETGAYETIAKLKSRASNELMWAADVIMRRFDRQADILRGFLHFADSGVLFRPPWTYTKTRPESLPFYAFSRGHHNYLESTVSYWTDFGVLKRNWGTGFSNGLGLAAVLWSGRTVPADFDTQVSMALSMLAMFMNRFEIHDSESSHWLGQPDSPGDALIWESAYERVEQFLGDSVAGSTLTVDASRHFVEPLCLNDLPTTTWKSSSQAYATASGWPCFEWQEPLLMLELRIESGYAVNALPGLLEQSNLVIEERDEHSRASQTFYCALVNGHVVRHGDTQENVAATSQAFAEVGDVASQLESALQGALETHGNLRVKHFPVFRSEPFDLGEKSMSRLSPETPVHVRVLRCEHPANTVARDPSRRLDDEGAWTPCAVRMNIVAPEPGSRSEERPWALKHWHYATPKGTAFALHLVKDLGLAK